MVRAQKKRDEAAVFSSKGDPGMLLKREAKWLWVKTLTPGEPQNRCVGVHPPKKMARHRLLAMAISDITTPCISDRVIIFNLKLEATCPNFSDLSLRGPETNIDEHL